MPPGFEGIDYNTARALFANEKAAFYIGGNYELGYFRSLNPSLQAGWIPPVAKITGAPRYVSTWADGAFAINSKTANKEAALKFLNFMTTKEFGQALVDDIAFIPTAPFVKITDPVVKAINKSRSSIGTPFLNVVGFRYETPTSSNILQPGFQKLIVGAITLSNSLKMYRPLFHLGTHLKRVRVNKEALGVGISPRPMLFLCI